MPHGRRRRKSHRKAGRNGRKRVITPPLTAAERYSRNNRNKRSVRSPGLQGSPPLPGKFLRKVRRLAADQAEADKLGMTVTELRFTRAAEWKALGERRKAEEALRASIVESDPWERRGSYRSVRDFF